MIILLILSIPELKGSSKKWIQLEQKLQFPREQHVALQIPDDFTSQVVPIIANNDDHCNCVTESG